MGSLEVFPQSEAFDVRQQDAVRGLPRCLSLAHARGEREERRAEEVERTHRFLCLSCHLETMFLDSRQVQVVSDE